MDAVLNYINECGCIVNSNIQKGKMPTDEQLHKFTIDIETKFKALSKDAPSEVQQKLRLPNIIWEEGSKLVVWRAEENEPGVHPAFSQGHYIKFDAPQLLDILKKIKDDLRSYVPKGKPAVRSKQVGKAYPAGYNIAKGGEGGLPGSMSLVIRPHYAQTHSGSCWIEPRHGGWISSPPCAPLCVSVEVSGTLETLKEASGYNKWRGSPELDLAEFVFNGKVLEPGPTLTEFGVRDGVEIDMYFAGSFTDQSINEH
eukprot:TRINITY_DN68439_c0_g1_i1.p1 TRINITY_DN68439_c0_g1~~TRINITY_DN68439_c0_g1_i1.p1  ORF type:complete len:255 (-),score=39.39 TRINITY_DN68439_c0_g1_i1:199-963(-)